MQPLDLSMDQSEAQPSIVNLAFAVRMRLLAQSAIHCRVCIVGPNIYSHRGRKRAGIYPEKNFKGAGIIRGPRRYYSESSSSGFTVSCRMTFNRISTRSRCSNASHSRFPATASSGDSAGFPVYDAPAC